MLTDERKAAVDSLTDDELEDEVGRGRASRLQGELYDYARTQLYRRDEAKRTATAQASIQIAQDGVRVAKQTRNATHIAWVVVLAVGIATVVTMCAVGN